MLFRKQLTEEEKNNIITTEKSKLRAKIKNTYLQYRNSLEIEKLSEDIASVLNCVSVELEHPSFAKVYYTNIEKTEYKMIHYRDYGMDSLSPVEQPIQCLSFIKNIAEKLNKKGFEFFLNDEDRYNAFICQSNYDAFIDEYLEKTFANCIIQTKPHIYCSYQLYLFDVLSYRKKGLYQVKNW